ncbi:MAG: hypothetical protein FWH20_06575 [Oscillospiraceae bacterium]|nr:hypothetical protein [Oscillospiraceae bacterium]
MRSSTQRLRDLTVFAMLGSVLFASRVILAYVPYLQLVGLFIAAFTLTYKTRALIPLYVYVLLEGIYGSFGVFWFAYLYIWLPLWASFMLAGKVSAKLPRKLQVPLYMLLLGLHGLALGLLSMPIGAFMFGVRTWQGALAWVAAGFSYDILHAACNLALGILILPLCDLLKKVEHIQQ